MDCQYVMGSTDSVQWWLWHELIYVDLLVSILNVNILDTNTARIDDIVDILWASLTMCSGCTVDYFRLTYWWASYIYIEHQDNENAA